MSLGLYKEDVLSVDGSDDGDHGGAGRNAEHVAVFERNVGNALCAPAGGVELEDDAASCTEFAHLADDALFFGQSAGVDCRSGADCSVALHADGEGGNVFVQPLLLEDASRFARETGAVEIGFLRETACALHQFVEGLIGADTVHASTVDFAFEANVLGLLVLRAMHVGLRKNGDDIAGLQFKILRSIVVDDELAQVEWHKRILECFWIEALDDGVRPVDFRSGDVDGIFCARWRQSRERPVVHLRACRG